MQGGEKGPDARRRPMAAREAYSLYVERAAAGANEADGPLSLACSADFPGFAGHQELRDIPRTAVRDRLLLLLEENLLVRGLAILAQQSAEGNRILGRPELGEQHGGGTIGRVVHPERALRHVLDLDHLGLDPVEHETAAIVGRPEHDGPAVLQPALV